MSTKARKQQIYIAVLKCTADFLEEVKKEDPCEDKMTWDDAVKYLRYEAEKLNK